ncbi:hypothetical protein YC2023_059754 [Brassica napus]
MASRWTKPKMRQTKTSGNKPIFCLQLLRFIRVDYMGKLCFSSYLPFGGGPGKCISETFASFENVVVAIEMLIRRFNFQTAPGAPSVKMTNRIHNTEGLKLMVTKRTKPLD